MKSARVAGLVLSLVAVLGGAIYGAGRLPVRSEEASSPLSPPMDLGDPATRRVAYWLMTGPANHFGGQWLGTACREEDAFERVVLSRHDMRQWTSRAAYFRLDRTGGNAFYQARPPSLQAPSFGRAWSLRKSDAERVRALLRSGGFPGLPAAGREGFCHSEITTLEICVHGRYHGALRMCEGVADKNDVALRRLADGLESILNEATQGETGRLAAAAAATTPSEGVPVVN